MSLDRTSDAVDRNADGIDIGDRTADSKPWRITEGHGEPGNVRLDATEKGRQTGSVHLVQGEVKHLKVARDEHTEDRAQDLIARARDKHGAPLKVHPEQRSGTPSPDFVDLLNTRESATRRFWDERRPTDLADTRDDDLRLEQIEPPSLSVVDKAFPGLYERDDRHPADVEPWESPDAWVEGRNPGRETDPGRWENCGDCTRVSEMRWRGVETTAAAITRPGEVDAVMRTWTQGEMISTDFDEISRRLDALGPGASALVGVTWIDSADGGHWFNALNDGGEITAVDGQQGRTDTWPPSRAALTFDERDTSGVLAVFIDSRGRHLTREEVEHLDA